MANYDGDAVQHRPELPATRRARFTVIQECRDLPESGAPFVYQYETGKSRRNPLDIDGATLLSDEFGSATSSAYLRLIPNGLAQQKPAPSSIGVANFQWRTVVWLRRNRPRGEIAHQLQKYAIGVDGVHDTAGIRIGAGATGRHLRQKRHPLLLQDTRSPLNVGNSQGQPVDAFMVYRRGVRGLGVKGLDPLEQAKPMVISPRNRDISTPIPNRPIKTPGCRLFCR